MSLTITTTVFDEDVNIGRFAGRCQNCGRTKREHAIMPPYRCQAPHPAPLATRGSYWLEWTPQAIAEVMKNEF